MSVARMRKPVLLLARLAVGGVLLVAGGMKVADPSGFERAIHSYALIPPQWSPLLATALPWVEVITGALLACGLWTRSSALCAAGMFACFVVAMGINLARGADIDCGCFGAEQDGSGLALWWAMVRSVALLAMSGVLVRESSSAAWSADQLLRMCRGGPGEPAARCGGQDPVPSSRRPAHPLAEGQR